MANANGGHTATDAILRELEKRISKEYKQAEQEVEEKLNDYLARFAKKDALKKKALANGLITQQEYSKWRLGQIAIGERWAEMRDTLAEDYSNVNQIARSIAYGYMPEVYALNHNYGTFLVESESLLDTSYTLYDAQAVEFLFNGGTFYPSPGRRVTERINMGLDVAWNKKQVESAMIQSILQGESIGGIATRVSQSVGETNRKAAIRNARTMTTCVENAGNVASYKRAASMGINVQQEWRATLDNRTRHEHRMVDGQRVGAGEPFKVDGYEMEYPGDPSAPGYLVYNCRCHVRPIVKGHEVSASDVTKRNNKLGDMSYSEWKKEKKSVSQSITHQDEVAETMKRVYGSEYKKYSKL